MLATWTLFVEKTKVGSDCCEGCDDNGTFSVVVMLRGLTGSEMSIEIVFGVEVRRGAEVGVGGIGLKPEVVVAEMRVVEETTSARGRVASAGRALDTEAVEGSC